VGEGSERAREREAGSEATVGATTMGGDRDGLSSNQKIREK